MVALWKGITSIITNIITLIGTVTTGLLANEIFQMLIGIVIFSILVREILKIVFFIKNKGDGCQINNKNKDEWVGVFNEKEKKHKLNKNKFYMINEDIENDFEYEMRALFDNDDNEFD